VGSRRSRTAAVIRLLAVCALLLLVARDLTAQDWPVHSMDRPRPAVVDPGPAGPPAPVPADAIVLFDGGDLSAWHKQGGGQPGWRVVDGVLEIVPNAGGIETVRAFGDVQLHVEWASPSPAVGEGQDRGNSGLFFMSFYEVQIVDSYDNDTYPDGQAASLYGQSPPLVNASRAPGEWQTYDIVFRRPHFGADGKMTEPARVTVFHNGVLVQDDVAMSGRTVHMRRAEYSPHEDALPLAIQDHASPVRFRRIWARPLPSR
jgi:hypothetical protein